MRKRVAIACQGGGSHTAFTAGVLKRLLAEPAPPFEIVALSGTSGGAVCALLAWYGLLTEGPARAGQLLEGFWQENAARLPLDVLLNISVVGLTRLRGVVALPEVSPYDVPNIGQERFRQLLEEFVDFASIPSLVREGTPHLFVGAVNVLSGCFTVFKNADVTADAVLASAAIPTFFRAVQIDDSAYWDGLFSQNPPIREMAHLHPDELWVVQINPRQSAAVPTSVMEIMDRRNELTGNLSLEQELHFVEKVNQWLANGHLTGTAHTQISVRRLMLEKDLDLASKLDRSPAFLEKLILAGEQAADTFLKNIDQTG
ncbi:MAG: patatin-like phospholipase family protein [Chloroflexaceae bacterium]|jgi:NTE family protein|nr:patatin-like phospholipase family protein [Chloroflexaceae bacterium]